MKKIVLGLLGLLSFSYNFPIFALNCNDALGFWQGSLPPLTSVNLFIHHPDIAEDASITFIDAKHVSMEYGMLHGTCNQQPDGSLLLTFSRHAYGANVNLLAKLDRSNQLTVINFSYGDNLSKGAGNGALYKM